MNCAGEMPGLLRAEAVAFDQIAAVAIADGRLADVQLLPVAGSNAHADRISAIRRAARSSRTVAIDSSPANVSACSRRIVAVFQMLLRSAGIEPHALVVGDAEPRNHAAAKRFEWHQAQRTQPAPVANGEAPRRAPAGPSRVTPRCSGKLSSPNSSAPQQPQRDRESSTSTCDARQVDRARTLADRRR